MILNQVMNALLLGCTYTLIAIGFSLFFGVLDVIVFCSGDIGIFGAFAVMGAATIIASSSLANLPTAIVLLIILAIALVLCSCLTLLTYYVSIKPFRQSSELMPLLSTIALGMVIREALGLFFPQGRNPQSFPVDLLPTGNIGGYSFLSYRNLIILGVTVLVLTILFIFLNKTNLGLSMQAISQNSDLANMTGLNINKTISFTFVIGGIVLAIAGFLVGAYQGVVRFDAGSMAGIKGFSAAVVGGLNSIYGAVVGGMLLGFVEVFVSGFIPGGTAYASVIAFLFVIIFMVFKPEGILGEKTIEKV